MHANSLHAYASIIDGLSPKRRQVLDAVTHLQPCTRQRIAEHLNWPINSVTGRVKELMDFGLIREYGNETQHVRGQPRALLGIVRERDYVPPPKRKSLREQYRELLEENQSLRQQLRQLQARPSI